MTEITGVNEGMSQRPVEYTMLIKKLKKQATAELSNFVEGMILYGSMVEGTIVGGESDCDIVIVLKPASTAEEAISMIQQVQNTLKPYQMDPIFSTLLDVLIVPNDALPKKGSFGGLGAIRASLLSRGETLMGSNPFEGLDVPQEAIRQNAKEMALEYFQNLVNTVFDPSLADLSEEDIAFEQTFIAIDSILGCAQAFLFYKGETGFSRNDAPYLIESKYANILDHTVIREAQALRLGSSGDRQNLPVAGIEFCCQVIAAIGGNPLRTISPKFDKPREFEDSASFAESRVEIEAMEAPKTATSAKPRKKKKMALSRVKGIGKKTRDQLQAVGISSAQDLAEKDSKELAELAGISEARAKKLIDAAKKAISE